MNLLDTFFNSCRCHDYDMIKNLSKKPKNTIKNTKVYLLI